MVPDGIAAYKTLSVETKFAVGVPPSTEIETVAPPRLGAAIVIAGTDAYLDPPERVLVLGTAVILSEGAVVGSHAFKKWLQRYTTCILPGLRCQPNPYINRLWGFQWITPIGWIGQPIKKGHVDLVNDFALVSMFVTDIEMDAYMV